VTTRQDVDDVEEETADRPEGEVAEEGGTQKPAGSVRRAFRWCKARWVPLVAAALLVGAAVLSAGLYFNKYRADQQTNSAAAHTAIQAASDGTVALLSYSPDSLDRDFSDAKAHLTGDFLSYYNHFTEQIVAPAAKQKGVTTKAAVVQSALSELNPDRAVVLLFINQTTTSTDRPEPALTSSSVLVSLSKVNGSWLISKFDPV
jgi:Mce-associated membrane protein